ncbi:MAG: ComF family protein [Candidatus Eisenbacteria bacterium]|uniref:ComF family protein n=1 Tax=Eiseniibacteriota bacterium TaxID=2212470 RepID=A0A9D6L7F7_UNCEI|nr:ComF family protein [Candidatus Eisenbacteria bacterium]MBI3540313.1 ComF family protein [Candidatus Eisenbacteria bacterium]
MRMAGVFSDLLEFALPQRCPGCGAAAESERLLCDACRDRIPPFAGALCARCLALGRDPTPCVRHAGFAVRAPWLYDERAALLVHALKYAERPGLAAALGEVMARALPPGYRPDLVIPVPLHRVRRRERGYNQAALLAASLAAAIGAPMIEDALTRVRPTAAQARLGPAARRANMAGAFRLAHPDAWAGRTVLVIDDVLTTGATLEACLATLRAGATPPQRRPADASALVLAWAQ